MMKKQNTKLAALILAGIIAFILACFTSCAGSKVVTVTEYKDRIVHDTMQVVDSVYRNQIRIMYMEGDTTYVHDSVFLYKYKYLNHDVNVYVHDSIPYPVEVEKIVRRRNGYDKFVSWGFWSLLVMLVVAIVIRVLIKIYLHK